MGKEPKVKPGIYILRVGDDKTITFWDAETSSEWGYILIDVEYGIIYFDYRLHRTVE